MADLGTNLFHFLVTPLLRLRRGITGDIFDQNFHCKKGNVVVNYVFYVYREKNKILQKLKKKRKIIVQSAGK